MKPLLADDWKEEKLVFPLIGQPKIDGVRGLNMVGKLTGRSLKQFGNKHATQYFSHSSLIGFDGEMAAESEVHPDLCRLTTSALASHAGEPWIMWHLFDYVTPETRNNGYEYRWHYGNLMREKLEDSNPDLASHLRMVSSVFLRNRDELEEFDSKNLELGYEGTILRDPNAPHKEGRSGSKPILWRIKRFVDFEFLITGYEEGEHNANEATINPLGYTERSTHQANMVPNGMIGALLGLVVKDVEIGGVMFEAGSPIKVAAGRMTHDERKRYFENFGLLNNKIGKAKVFPKGMKDKLRFPTFQSLRDPADIS